jgi:hypothetical protein
MKTISKILSAAIVLMTASNAKAQSSTSADAFATIIAPITIAKAVDMNFGNVAVQGATSVGGAAGTGGTVVLAPGGTRTATGGVTLPGSVGTVTAASFNVTGDGNRTYAITLPSSDVTLTHSGNVATMAINAFTSNPSGTGTLSSGAQTLNVGATLNVAVGQLPGVYTGQFTVMVNYN